MHYNAICKHVVAKVAVASENRSTGQCRSCVDDSKQCGNYTAKDEEILMQKIANFSDAGTKFTKITKFRCVDIVREVTTEDNDLNSIRSHEWRKGDNCRSQQMIKSLNHEKGRSKITKCRSAVGYTIRTPPTCFIPVYTRCG